MKPPGASDIVVRYGDMSTKSNRVQTKLEKQLVSNIEALLQDRNIDATVERKWTRPIVHTDEAQVEAATQAITKVFGVVSVSPALTVNATREEIKQALAKTAKKEYTSGSFAVRARRASDTYPFTSQDIGEFGGSAVWNAVADSFEPAVDLDDPDIEFFVEVRDDNAYVFLEKRAGPGGLPLGSQDPVVALISGGIDSPVAAYEMMKRGCPIIPVYIDLGDYGGPDHEARAMAAISTLKEYAPNFEISPIRVPGGETIRDIANNIEKGRMLVFRRYMYTVAEYIACENNAVGIVTGEAVGQKSSQTAQNFKITSRITDLPIHRPLLSMDKNTITNRAKEIGTFTAATIPAGCNRFAPEKPETAGQIQTIKAKEPDDLIDRAREDAKQATEIDATEQISSV